MDKQAEAAKRLKERQQAAKKRFTLPEGDTVLRVLPNAKGLDRKEFVEYGMHSNVGPRKAYIRCGKTQEGEGDCWLCDEMLPKLSDSEKATRRKAAEEMARGDRFAVQIAVMDEDENWSGPHLWEMPNKLANTLLGMLSKRDIANPKKGYNITASRTGTTFTTTRYPNFDRDDDPSPAPEKVMAKLKPFGDVVPKYSEEDMKAAYYGHEQEEEEERPTRRPAVEEPEPEEERPRRRRPVAEEPEPEEEERPRRRKDEDEEEASRQTGKKPGKRTRPVEADEDADLEAALEEDFAEEESTEKEEEVPDLDEEERPRGRSRREREEEGDGEQDERPARKPTSGKRRPVEEEEEPRATAKGKPGKSKSRADDDF